MRFLMSMAFVTMLVAPVTLAAQMVGPATSAAMTRAVAEADLEATRWFGLIRADDVRSAWERTTRHFKQRINRETFERIWSPHGGRLQPVVARRITAVRYVLPSPPEQPEVVVFDTRVEFRGGTFGGETLTLTPVEGAGWRVWEYAVAPSSNPRDR